MVKLQQLWTTAAVAAVGMGALNDFRKIDKIHEVEYICEPENENVEKYQKLLKVFKAAREAISSISDMAIKEVFG